MSTEKENLLKLPTTVLVEDLLYYKQDHEAMLYISSKLEDKGLKVEEPLHKWVVRKLVNQERVKKGKIKLLKSLNAGKSVYADEGIVSWLEEWGFEVEVLPLPDYQGNLPEEERIVPIYIKLKEK